MATLNLTDHFDSPTGEFIGYLDANGNPVSTGKHLNLRSFHPDNITIPNSMINNGNINAWGLNGKTMGTLNSPIVFTGTSVPPLEMGQLDSLEMNSVDLNSMHNMEGAVSPGQEGWTGTGVSLVRDSGLGYISTIQVALTGGVTATATSTYVDDIYTNFTDFNDYIIELELLSFPAQSAGSHLNLTNSFIDFTSSPTYAAGLTDTFSFSQSISDLSGGGNVNFQIPRSALTHVNLQDITGIRLRLLSVGNMTFEAANMTMYSPSASAYFDSTNSLSIDTKRGWIYQRVPHYQVGGQYGGGQYSAGNYGTGGSGAVSVYEPMILPGSRPKNVTVVTKFMPGTVLGTQPTTITLFAREYTYPVSGTLSWSSSGSSLSISDKGGTLYTSGNLTALSANTEYYLVFEAYEERLRLSVWNGTGTSYGTNVYTSGWQSTSRPVGRGYIGFEFNPVNFDTYMQYFTVGDAEFARLESKIFNRFTGAKGAAISTVNSPPINLLGVVNNYGDGATSTNFEVGTPAPPSTLIQRTGSSWSGGLITASLFIGNPAYLRVTGDIFPVPTGNSINGEYRIIFQNRYGQIGYVATLQNILPKQWNHFEIPFNGQLGADTYQVIFEQTGYFADSFYLSNFDIESLTFAWELSPDNGATFYPFLFATNDKHSGVNFTENTGRNLIVRGIALSDTSWLKGYELVPLEGVSIAPASVIPITSHKTQTGVARITATPSFTQTGHSRITKSVTKTQSALSRISITGTKTQSAIAHINSAFTPSLDTSDIFRRGETAPYLKGKTISYPDQFKRNEAVRVFE